MVRRITRKEMKQPDEFISTTTQVIGFIARNLRTIVPAVIVLLIAGAGIAFSRYQAQEREQKAQEMLFRAQFAHQRYLAFPPVDDEEQEVQEEKKKEKEQLLKDAEARLRTLIETYPNTDAAWHAQFTLASILYEQRDFLAAIDTYEKIRAHRIVKKNTNVKAILDYNLGHLYETLGYMERALEYYRSVMELGSNLYTQMIGEDLKRVQWKSDILQGKHQPGLGGGTAPAPAGKP